MTSNFALNPSFEGVAGSWEVARNYHPNPGAVPGRGGYANFAGAGNTQVAELVESSWPASGRAFRVTWTNVTNPAEGSVQCRLYAPGQNILTPGGTYTVVCRTVVGRTGISLNAPTLFTTSPLSPIAQSRSVSVTSEAGEIVTDWVTFVCPENAASSNFRLSIITGSTVSGDWAEMSMADIYPGEYQPNRQWFSDVYSQDLDLVPSLSGTASVLRATGVSGIAAGNANGWKISSSQWASSGGRSVRNYRAAPGTTDSYIGFPEGWFPDFGPGKVYGVKAKVRLSAPLSGTTVSQTEQARRLRRLTAICTVPSGDFAVIGSPDQYPNEAGVHEIQWVFTVPEGATGLTAFRVYSGHSFGDHWVDDFMVVTADTEAEAQAMLADTFFWGDAPTETRPDGYTRQSWWEGTTNNSVSVRGEWEPGVLSGWIAAHTGMPSLRVTVPGPVYAGDRLLVNPTQLPALVSDPLAPPGVPIVYRQGEHQVTLVRPSGEIGHALFTDIDGRGIDGIVHHVNDTNPISQDLGVTLFNGQIPQWDKQTPARTGSSTLFLHDPGLESKFWELVHRKKPFIIASARPTHGVAMVCAVISQVNRTRVFRHTGSLLFEVTWTEHSGTAASAPVVTWGEYEAHSDGWTDESYEELCRRVAGMP